MTEYVLFDIIGNANVIFDFRIYSQIFNSNLNLGDRRSQCAVPSASLDKRNSTSRARVAVGTASTAHNTRYWFFTRQRRVLNSTDRQFKDK